MKPLDLAGQRPLVWAHRGGRGLGPENTLHTLRKGYAAGANGWETDVQLTKDGKLILLHDLGLLRLTNAGALPHFRDNPPAVPWRFTLEELHLLRADAFPRRACPQRNPHRPWLDVSLPESSELGIPTLEMGLDLTLELGMWINIEIKDLTRSVPRPLADTVVQKVLNAVEERNMADQVIISSFNHDYIRESKQLAPHVLTGALTAHRFPGDPIEATLQAGADAWHPGHRFLTEAAVSRAREGGLFVTPYTVNEVSDMRRLTDWGVSGIVTDFPDRAAR